MNDRDRKSGIGKQHGIIVVQRHYQWMPNRWVKERKKKIFAEFQSSSR